MSQAIRQSPSNDRSRLLQARRLTHYVMSLRNALSIALVLVVATTFYMLYARTVYPKRLAEVIPGRLYRCGRLTPKQLDFVHDRYGFRSIVSLVDPHHPSADKERDWAAVHHVQWLSVPLPGDGTTNADQRELLKQLLIHDAAMPPVLVHCAAGSSRTGVACALVRICAIGWSAEEAIAEMKRFGFECNDGEVHAMLHKEAKRHSRRQRDPPNK